MKTNKLILIGLAIALFCGGCTKEEDIVAGDYIRTATLAVSDGGFLSAESDRTRAAEAGYRTVFTNGDRIGMIVVENSNNLITNNQPFTYNGTGWADAMNGTTISYDANHRYLFYYPYSEAMNGKTSLEEVKAAFVPKADQRAYADYTASDLMVGEGSFNKNQKMLKVALQHAMTLLVLDVREQQLMPDGTTLTWTSSHLSLGGFTIGHEIYAPHQDGDRKIRLLLPPSFAGGEVQFFYTFRNQRKAGAATLQGGSTGTYQCIHRTYDYVHALGDAYYSDGTVLPPETGYGAKPVGIVFWLGDITNDDPLLKKKFPQGTKGLAVALHDAGNNSYWSSGYEDITDNWLKNQSTTYGITSLKEQNKMQGYANTQALMDYNTKSSNVQTNSSLKVLPIEAITTYASAHPTPASSSGWYFPSVKELKYMCWGQGATSQSTAGRDFLNAQFEKVSGTSLQSGYYWSSTEHASGWTWRVNFNNGNVNYSSKSYNSFGVRAVTAF